MTTTRVLARSLPFLLLVFASPPAAADIQIFPRQGRVTDSTITPHGPGVVVMGGNYDVDDAFVWMQATVAGQGAAGGDVVVLRDPDPRAGHDDDYTAYILALAPFASVQTVVLSGTVSAGDAAQAAALVDKAEAVFFGGGDQRDYVGWRGPLLDAVQRVHDRNGVVGGTSAGSALWGAHVNDAIGEHRYGSTLSPDAIANPYDPSITFTHGLFAIPFLERVITDSHFQARDRFGRLAAFTARLVTDGAVADHALGMGVDEDGALVIDRRGLATFLPYKAGKGGAWIMRGGAATAITRGAPLVDTVTVMRLDARGQWFDLARECGNGAGYVVAIDGRASSAYAPADPYGGSGALMACAPPSDAGSPPSPPADGGNVRDAGTAPPSLPAGADAGRGAERDAAAPGAAAGDDATDLLPASSAACACSVPGSARGMGDTLCLGASSLAALVVVLRRRRPMPRRV